MTKEERAKIARENGAKGKGPVTSAGKEKSARNALKTGEHAEKFAHFIPPHEAAVCNEDRKEYQNLVEQLVAIYKPQNQSAYAVVGDMAAARWQMNRLKTCTTIQWNMAFIAATQKPAGNLVPEMRELQILADACTQMLSGNGILSKINREITRLQQIFTRGERQIKFIHANFPDYAPDPAPEKRTEAKPQPPVENTTVSEPEPETGEENSEPIYTTEHSATVIAAYRQQYPKRIIVILPPEEEDHPQKAA